MKNNRPTVDFIYNPDNQTKEQLIDSFVVRLKTFRRLFSDIEKSTMKSPEQHYLIEGKRGMGKTTLLLRLGYEIENNEKLNPWLIPIVFNEEEYSIRRLYKLWERIAILLEDKADLFFGLYDEMDKSYDNYPSEEAYEYGIFKLLNQRLEEKGKKLILFIDNFGDIFSKFNKQEIQRFRTVLQTGTNFRILAASSRVLEAFYDNQHPFYEHFKVSRLRGLNKEESEDLLLKLGEAYKQEQIKAILENQPGRVEALRRLTGGVIRTIVLLFEIFIDQKQGTAFTDLEAILDRVTPLYKHRMDNLPAQQQEIVEAIAFAWDAISVSEISQKTRIASKTVSAQIRQMEKNEIITKKQTNTKNHFYQFSERFFNIWYLMRHGRKGDKRKVLWLVRFLEEWCDEGELVARANRHIHSLKKGNYNIKGAYYLTEALASTRALPSESQDKLIKATRDFLTKNKSDFVGHLSESDLELYEKGMDFYKGNQYSLALPSFMKMKKKDFFRLGFCFNELADYVSAEKYYLQAVVEGYVSAMYNLALLYHENLADYVSAEKYYLQAVGEGDVSAMNNLANLYKNELADYVSAEKYYLQAVGEGDVSAMYNLANLYANKLADYVSAEKYYLQAVGEGHVSAMYNLALLYANELADYVSAEKYYLQAVGEGHVYAMNNLALLYDNELEDYVSAEKYYLQAVGEGHVSAMNNLAVLYENELADYVSAEKYYLQAVGEGDVSAMNNLALLYYQQKIKKTESLDLIKRHYEKENDDISKFNYALILLWNNHPKASQSIAEQFLYDKKFLTDYIEALSNYLYLLLAKKQYPYLYDYFTSPKAEALHIKDQLKPIWYALMHYMKDKYPNEYLRMGAELEETVKEIIEKVEQMRIDYA